MKDAVIELGLFRTIKKLFNSTIKYEDQEMINITFEGLDINNQLDEAYRQKLSEGTHCGLKCFI